MAESAQTEAPTTAPAPTDAPTSDATASTDAAALETQGGADWRAVLDGVDPEELLKHPKIAGRLGDLAEKRARALREQVRREVEAEMEAQRLRKLRDEDPFAFAQADREREQQLVQQARQAEQGTAVLARVQQDLASYVTEHFPKDVVEKLAGKTYPGDYGQGMAAYIRDLTEATRAHQEEAQRKALEPAIRKQVLAELNGDTSPEVAAGGTAAVSSGPVTQQEWNRNKSSRAWRMANRARINAGLTQGLITHD